ncbi:ferritin-like domain-containing protein [Kribbella sp. CA-245084]|uniref:ferritin-like domain-containing protein n=1 Tax=Kribbella sp. CA-245084 TaxID=3239940 RepID=UPI003D8A9418
MISGHRSTHQKLGGTPVGAPAVDFGGAFDSRKSYLTTAHIFENKGVGAYLGAAGFVKDKMILQAAAGIFGVEARHAAVVGNLLGLKAEGGVYMGSTEVGIPRPTSSRQSRRSCRTRQRSLPRSPTDPPDTFGRPPRGRPAEGLCQEFLALVLMAPFTPLGKKPPSATACADGSQVRTHPREGS